MHVHSMLPAILFALLTLHPAFSSRSSILSFDSGRYSDMRALRENSGQLRIGKGGSSVFIGPRQRACCRSFVPPCGTVNSSPRSTSDRRPLRPPVNRRIPLVRPAFFCLAAHPGWPQISPVSSWRRPLTFALLCPRIDSVQDSCVLAWDQTPAHWRRYTRRQQASELQPLPFRD